MLATPDWDRMVLSASCGHHHLRTTTHTVWIKGGKGLARQIESGKKREKAYWEKLGAWSLCHVCQCWTHSGSPQVLCHQLPTLHSLRGSSKRPHGSWSCFTFLQEATNPLGPLVGLQSSFHLSLVNSSCLVHYLSVSCSGLKNMCFCDPFILNWKLENNRPWGTSKRKTGASYCLWTWTHLQKFCTAMWKSFNNKSCMIVINLHPWPISHSTSTKLKWDDWFLSSFQTMSNF